MGTRLVNLVAEPRPGRPGIPLVFVPVPDPKTGPNRVHLDLASASEADQAARSNACSASAPPRPTSARARLLGGLADPEGNELCVLVPPLSGPGFH